MPSTTNELVGRPLVELAVRYGIADSVEIAGARLARVLAWLGENEAARELAERSLSSAELGDDREERARALGLLALLDGIEGELERAVARADDAAVVLTPSAPRDAVVVLLDAAELLLAWDGPLQTSAAATRLAQARDLVQARSIDALRPRLRALLAWARGATGDVRGGIAELDALERELGRDALEERLLATTARARLVRLVDGEAATRMAFARAVEVLEDLATSVPRAARATFLAAPRRAAIRRDARERDASQPAMTSSDAARDGRYTRLLEISKRLAAEHELPRLLERITESAVDLSGAERGFVLLTDADGKLEPMAARDAARPDDPHVVFSRSIAEAVLIDGEPIVTTDARHDDRLNAYTSVHQLMLQSVACLPIRDRELTLGVLYVEHRVRRGRFGTSDIELLLALASLSAVALRNARQLQDLAARSFALEEANRHLEDAKAEIERLLDARTSELDETKRELQRTRESMRGASERYGIVGRSASIRRVLQIVERVADSTVPVVIHGESGTGKELVARAIHAASRRARRPFVALNCGAVPDALLESELFGHKKGAFTGADRDRPGVFQQADGGTLFLDEIGDMPGKMQVELLRVLADGKVRPVGGEDEITVDVRVVAASNKLLGDLVKKGAFREDLFYRLNVVELRLPALRDRREDIPLLIEHFLAVQRKRDGRAVRVSRDAITALTQESWPGNIRQLEHVLLNAAVMAEDDTIQRSDFALLAEAPPIERAAPPRGGPSLAANVDEWKDSERRKILEALDSAGWNRLRAAELIGMPRRTFYRRLKEYGILEEGATE